MWKSKTLMLAIAAALALHGAAQAATPAIEPVLVAVPAGEFTMGSNAKKGSSPAHQVQVRAFQMGKYEVTVHEFARFAAATGYQGPQRCVQMAGKEWFDDVPGSWRQHRLMASEFEPVTCIGAAGADAYVQWLAKVTGKHYRLPTEAEWEYAARAGTTSTHFFGEDADPASSGACRWGNVADRRAEGAIKRDFDGLESKEHNGVVACDDGADYASVVGLYEANPWGLHDTLGNVQEYVQDCHHDSYEGAPTDGSAWLDGSAACKERGLRGGTWHWPVFHSARRGGFPVDMVGSLEGLRVVLDEPGPVAAPSAQTRRFLVALGQAQARERARRAQAGSL